MNLRYKNSIQGLLPLLAIALMCGFLVSREGDVLFRAQELSLFLTTPQYFRELCIYPGGALSWLACLATTVFYSPWLAGVMLFVLWAFCAVMLVWLFDLKGWWRLLSLLLPVALLACLTETGYWLYYQKLPGHMMVPTLAVALALACCGIGLRLRKRWPLLAVAFLVLWGCIGYPLLGAWSFLGTALMMWPLKWERKQWPVRIALPIAIGLALIIIVPQVAYEHFYCQTARSQLYLAAMPTFAISEQDFPQYRLPYYAILLALALPMAYTLKPEKLLPKGWQALMVSGLLVLAALYRLSRVWYTDENFHREIRQSLAIEEQDWERVLRIAREPSSTMPTRVMVLNRNLALFKLGRAGSEVFHYREGDTRPNAPWLVRISQVNGKMLYYQYGLENFCYRWCIEQGIETGWNVDGLRLLVKTALLNREDAVARKYIELLKKTLFHRRWATHYEAFLDHPERIAEDPEMEAITHLMEGNDRLDSDHMQVELYLINSLATSSGTDPLRQELNLLCAMLSRDIPLFWARFFEYAPTHASQGIPRHYQEAAYLYGQLERQTVDTSHMPFDEEVRRSYADFMRFNDQCGAMTMEQKKRAFYPLFGKTFYYYYFLVRGLKTL